MSYRLKGKDLENFFKLCTDYKRISGRALRFYAQTDSDGRRVNDIVKSVYANVYSYTNYGVLGIGNYKDFNMTFKTAEDAKKVYEDIEGAMEAYGESGAGTVLDGGEEKKGGLGQNTNTYIIIGAVVVVLAVLLLTRKRK